MRKEVAYLELNVDPPIDTTVMDDYRGLLRRIESGLGVTGIRMAKLFDTTKQAYSQLAQMDNGTLRTISKLEKALNMRILIVDPALEAMLQAVEEARRKAKEGTILE